MHGGWNKLFTPDQMRLIGEHWVAGTRKRDMREMFRCSDTTIDRVRKHLGLEPRPQKEPLKRDPVLLANIIRLYEAGKSFTQISKEVGLHKSMVGHLIGKAIGKNPALRIKAQALLEHEKFAIAPERCEAGPDPLPPMHWISLSALGMDAR